MNCTHFKSNSRSDIIIHMADIESCDLYKASRADLLKACRLANRELCQHKLYLDQLLTVVIDKHPEVLSLVAEAQKMRLPIQS